MGTATRLAETKWRWEQGLHGWGKCCEEKVDTGTNSYPRAALYFRMIKTILFSDIFLKLGRLGKGMYVLTTGEGLGSKNSINFTISDQSSTLVSVFQQFKGNYYGHFRY